MWDLGGQEIKKMSLFYVFQQLLCSRCTCSSLSFALGFHILALNRLPLHWCKTTAMKSYANVATNVAWTFFQSSQVILIVSLSFHLIHLCSTAENRNIDTYVETSCSRQIRRKTGHIDWSIFGSFMVIYNTWYKKAENIQITTQNNNMFVLYSVLQWSAMHSIALGSK